MTLYKKAIFFAHLLVCLQCSVIYHGKQSTNCFNNINFYNIHSCNAQ